MKRYSIQKSLDLVPINSYFFEYTGATQQAHRCQAGHSNVTGSHRTTLCSGSDFFDRLFHEIEFNNFQRH
jgi:hypothetical protein